MVIDTFTIVLDNGMDTFTPGSTIKGNVVVKKRGNEVVSVINVRLFGSAETKWTVKRTESYSVYHSSHSFGSYGHSSGGHWSTHYYTVIDHYAGMQPLLENSWVVFGNGISYQPLPSDELRLPFSFQISNKPLPFNCNIENEGWVTYGLQATMRCASYTAELNTSLPITILSLPLDLNGVPGVNIPIAEKVDKTFGCCCPSEPIFMVLNLPKRGLAVGETVPVVVQIQNQSEMDIVEIYAELSQVWTLLAHNIEGRFGTDSRTHVVPLTRLARGKGAVSGKVKNDIWNFEMQVPSVAPSLDDSACPIIKMSYSLRVVASLQGHGCCGGDESVEVGSLLIIGNIPAELGNLSQHSSAYVATNGFG